MDVLPHIGKPCKVVNAPMASILPQESNMNSRRLLSCLMEVGSFCNFLHALISNFQSRHSNPIDFGSLLMGQKLLSTANLLVLPNF
jgi:hypothetical protein